MTCSWYNELTAIQCIRNVVWRMITVLLNRAIIGENAKKARESNGFSQASVADFLSVDQSLISKFEKGERTIQSEMLERLANLYGYTIADFLRDEGIPKQQLKAA